MSGLTDEEKITKDSYNKLASSWSNAHLTFDLWEKELYMFHKLLPQGRVLEVGCGGGRDARGLINLGYEYLGTDISSGLLAEARKNNPNADFEEVSLYNLDFDEPFDGFWCSAVLLHIPRHRLKEALSSIKKNLRKGAIGFISLKEGNGEKMDQDPKFLGDSRLFVYWQTAEFKKILESNGFEVIHEGYRPLSERSKWLTYFVKLTS